MTFRRGITIARFMTTNELIKSGITPLCVISLCNRMVISTKMFQYLTKNK